MNRRYLLIGEQRNAESNPRWDRIAFEDPRTWIEISVRQGAFGPHSRKRLRSLGIELSPDNNCPEGPGHGVTSMNLLPPCPAGTCPWPAYWAESVGRAVLAECYGKYSVIFAAGRRVATALGVHPRMPIMTRHQAYTRPDQTKAWGILGEDETCDHELVILPHPSGRSRFWNSEVDVLLARSDLEIYYDLPEVR